MFINPVRRDPQPRRPALARLRARLLAWMYQDYDPLLNQWTRRLLS